MADIPFSYCPSQQTRKDLTYGIFNWKTAEDQYKQGQYLAALGSTITYLDAAIGAKFIADPEAGVCIAHGSMQLFVTVSNGELQLLAPFINIATAQKIVILRKICEINFNGLSLAKIECKEDTLSFLFRCPLEECEPWKMYDIFKEICWTADKYDDEFVTLHGAVWAFQPIVTDYSNDRKELAWKGFKQSLAEAKEWITNWKQLGYPYIAWDTIYMTLMKIDHICAPQGTVKNLIETNIDRLFEKRDINDLVNDGMTCLQAFDNMQKEALFTQLYDVSIFIPAKITGSAANVQNCLKQSLTDTYNYITKNEFISGYLAIQKAMYRLLYNYRFNEVQWKHLDSILSSITGLSVVDATNKMYDQLNEFYTNPRDQSVAAPAPDKKEEKKSLFSSWFN